MCSVSLRHTSIFITMQLWRTTSLFFRRDSLFPRGLRQVLFSLHYKKEIRDPGGGLQGHWSNHKTCWVSEMEWCRACFLSDGCMDFKNPSMYVVPKRSGRTSSFVTPKLMRVLYSSICRSIVIAMDTFNFVWGALRISGILRWRTLSSQLGSRVSTFMSY